MCGRFFRHGVTWEEYHDALGLVPPDGVDPPEPTYNAAPTTLQPVFRLARDKIHTEVLPARWGLIPSWWTKPIQQIKFTSINAQSETVNEKPVFRGAFRHRRCLVPVSGYYEWSVQGRAKTPFAFGLKNRRWFCLAGLWDTALIDGSEIDSFTILTTRPNEFTAGIHDRMPVILAPEDYALWLDPARGDPSRLFAPYPSDPMQTWIVGPAVGNVRNNYPGLIDEI
jgi:putative SOS response-associated peptidase YedK